MGALVSSWVASLASAVEGSRVLVDANKGSNLLENSPTGATKKPGQPSCSFGVGGGSILVEGKGAVMSLDGELLACPGKSHSPAVAGWVRKIHFAKRISNSERFNAITGDLLLEWDGHLWVKALVERRDAGFDLQSVWVCGWSRPWCCGTTVKPWRAS